MRKTLLQEIAERVEVLRLRHSLNLHEAAKSRHTSKSGRIDETHRLQRLAGIINESFEDVEFEEKPNRRLLR